MAEGSNESGSEYLPSTSDDDQSSSSSVLNWLNQKVNKDENFQDEIGDSIKLQVRDLNVEMKKIANDIRLLQDGLVDLNMIHIALDEKLSIIAHQNNSINEGNDITIRITSKQILFVKIIIVLYLLLFILYKLWR